MTTRIRVDATPGVLDIVLDTPDRNNAIDRLWVEQFLAALETRTEEHHAVLVRAEGRNFCVGGDVRAFGDDPGAGVGDLAEGFHRVIRALDDLEVPIVAAVHGWAAGAGISLALAADVLLVADDARFRTAYNALGLTGDGGITWRLPRRVGSQLALDLLLTDRALDADEAVTHGLAARKLPAGDLAAAASELAGAIAALPGVTSRAITRLVREGRDTSLDAQLDAERDAIAAAAGSDEGRARIAAFVAR